ncbi:contact-dependent growth inhibition system immunity protein [Actinoplanes sp. NPDC089786]|uniref:contact-dependent growth inhibition system immunity protein n=1 Tax=Actinoplanes sp. NPDC089786 TaxID=3155185 RepID=UPI003440F995
MTTIEEIEGMREPDPGPGATTLIRRCTELRRKPVAGFTAEDLRIMLGQRIAVPILLPRAVDVLVRDPPASGDMYTGDLLTTVLRLPDTDWPAGLRDRLSTALRGVRLPGSDLRRALAAFLDAG